MKQEYKYLIKILNSDKNKFIEFPTTEKKLAGLEKLVETGLIKLKRVNTKVLRDALPSREYKITAKYEELIKEVYVIFEKYLRH